MVGTWIFISGIIINELLLMLQGVTGLSYVVVPEMDKYLLMAALLMFSGIAVMNAGLKRKAA
jgi:hypothetical protein